MVRSIRRKSEAPSGERSALRLQCDGFRLKTGERMHPHAAQSSTRRGSLGSGPHSPAAHVAACDGRAAGARAHRSGAPSGQRRSPRHALRRPGGGRRRVWPHAATSRSALSAMARQTLPLASRWTMRSPPSRTVTSQPQVAGAGTRREIEIWFALINRTVYLLAGGGDRANWVRNLRVEPRAVVQIGDRALGTRGREPQPGAESDEARRALFAKYSTARSELTRWRDHGLLVALDLE
jgi:hypothetical protein